MTQATYKNDKDAFLLAVNQMLNTTKNEWEQKFLTSISDQANSGKYLSDKQWAIFDKLYNQLVNGQVEIIDQSEFLQKATHALSLMEIKDSNQWARDFLASIVDQINNNRRLSAKQIEILTKNYDSVTNPSPAKVVKTTDSSTRQKALAKDNKSNPLAEFQAKMPQKRIYTNETKTSLICSSCKLETDEYADGTKCIDCVIPF